MIIVVVILRYPLFLSLCTTSSLDRTEGQTKNRPVSMARVSCLFSLYPNVEQLYICVCIQNHAYTDEGQMMMMVVVVVDLLDGCCRYNVREKDEERKE
jgi:hypothetical protein